MNKVTHWLAMVSVTAGILLVFVPMLHAQEEAAATPEADEATPEVDEATPEMSEAAIPAQLDETRTAIFELFNEEKYAEIAEKYCHEEITCLWNDGTTTKGRQGVVEFFAHLKTFINEMQCAPTTQDRAVFADGEYIVSIGQMGDTYKMASGKEFELESVWMATLAHEDGEWKLISFAVSTDAFDNQVIDAYLLTRTFVAGGVGIVIGLLAMLLILRLKKRS